MRKPISIGNQQYRKKRKRDFIVLNVSNGCSILFALVGQSFFNERHFARAALVLLHMLLGAFPILVQFIVILLQALRERNLRYARSSTLNMRKLLLRSPKNQSHSRVAMVILWGLSIIVIFCFPNLRNNSPVGNLLVERLFGTFLFSCVYLGFADFIDASGRQTMLRITVFAVLSLPPIICCFIAYMGGASVSYLLYALVMRGAYFACDKPAI